jgi:hypothetical protein
MDSRPVAFATDPGATGARHDVVLNSLADAFIPKVLLLHWGRF